MSAIFHDVEQNSEIWLKHRAGKVTSSGLAKIMASYGKAFGEPAKKYASDIALEQITGEPVSSDFSNAHMDRGHEEEPIARMMYEDEYFCTVEEGGFYELGDMGASPDGNVGKDGLIEIKSAIPSAHYSRVSKQSYDTTYKWQLANSLKISGRDWIDFISYCAGYPLHMQLYIYRCHKEDFEQEFEMIDNRMEQFRELVNKSKDIILSSNYFLGSR